MLIWLVTIILSSAVFGLVLWLLLRVRTPHYRVSSQQVRELLEQVVVGQANSNDWAVFLAYQIRDNLQLEKIRQQCVLIDEREYRSHGDYLLTQRGRDQVEAILRMQLMTSVDLVDPD